MPENVTYLDGSSSCRSKYTHISYSRESSSDGRHHNIPDVAVRHVSEHAQFACSGQSERSSGFGFGVLLLARLFLPAVALDAPNPP